MFRFLGNIFSRGRKEPAQQAFAVDIPSERELTPERKRSELLDSVTPPVPFELVDEIEKLVLSTPDLSQAVERTISFANTGHQVSFEGLSEAESVKAREELKDFAKTAFKPAAGIDSLVDAILRQVTIRGALSAEAIPEGDFSGIRKVELVPVKEVRFKRNDRGDWAPFQTGIGEDVELNEHQYMYIPLQRDEKSPYGIPPFIAALDTAKSQKDFIDRIKEVIRKIGLLGFVHAKKKPAPNNNEAPREYTARLKKNLEDFAKSFRENFAKSGVAVSYDDVTIDHKSVTGDARGAADLFQIGEEQLASGIDMDPSLLGRSYSTTETYAGVVYESFLSKLRGRQRVLKRFLEKVYWLHLVLKGFRVKAVTVTFNPSRSLDPAADAQAKNFELLNILLKQDAGWISADEAAREAGYEKATGTKATAATMRALKKKTAILHRATTKAARGTNLIPFRKAD